MARTIGPDEILGYITDRKAPRTCWVGDPATVWVLLVANRWRRVYRDRQCTEDGPLMCTYVVVAGDRWWIDGVARERLMSAVAGLRS